MKKVGIYLNIPPYSSLMRFILSVFAVLIVVPVPCSRASLESHGFRNADILLRFTNETYMSEVPRSVTACIAHPELHSKAFCQEQLYLLEVKDYITRWTFSPISLSGKKRRIPKVPPVVDISTEPRSLTYQHMFENFVVKNKPFKGAMDSTTSADGDNHLTECQSLVNCSRQLNVHHAMNDSSINQISTYLDRNSSLAIPKVAVNNYLYRVNAMNFSTNFENGQERNTFLPLLTQWPSTFHLKRGDEPGAVHQCPANMHMVLWTTTVSSNVKARIFPQTFGKNFGFDFESFPLHSPGFRNHGFPPPDEEFNLPVFTDTFMASYQFLFIPSNLIVSLAFDNNSGKTEKSINEKNQLYRMCFVDASNFNNFRKYLDLVGKVSEYEAALGTIVQNPKFPTSMRRELTDGEHFKLLKNGNSEIAEYLSSGEEAPISKKKGRNRANRRNRGKSEDGAGGGAGGVFKEWQESNKWNKMVTSLTIPAPKIPQVISVGRKNATFEWISPFLPGEGDKTAFGFNITLCVENVAEMGICRNYTLERTHDENKPTRLLEQKPSKNSHSSQDISSTTKFSVDVTDLEPSTSYRFRMNLFFDSFQSLPSEWSSIFFTAPLTVPSRIPLPSGSENQFLPNPTGVTISPASCTSINVVALKPVDDGGFPILGYQVFSRFVEDGYHNEWILNGHYSPEKSETSISFEMKNVFPGPLYEVALSAYNELGVANLSAPSNHVACTCDRKRFSGETIHGHGLQKMYAPFTSTTVSNKDMLLVIDTTDQLVKCVGIRDSDSMFAIDSWAGHHSLHVKVKAPAMWVLDQSNGESLVGKVAIVHRSGEPLVLKARSVQKAGAVGMIIIDSEDRCGSFDQACVPGATKRLNEGWGRSDVVAMWKNVHMPMVLVRKNATNLLASCRSRTPRDEL